MSDAPQPTRSVPLPRSVSDAARAALEAMYALDLGDPAPPGDVAAWEALVAFTDEMLVAIIPPADPGTRSEASTLGGVPVHDVRPAATTTEAVCLFLHGGAFTMGGGAACAAMTASFAEGAQARTIGVDYRMPPRHPYPAALDDCVAAYRALLDDHDPADVVVAGISAGGNLAAALPLRARDEGLPLPCGVVLLTPEVDLTESGDSYGTLMGIDPVLRSSLSPGIDLYAGGHDLTDPRLSPLFADFAPGYPRTFVQCGTRDLFLSNAARFHRALRRDGIPAELHVWDGMPHGGFGAMLEGGLGSTDEDREVYEAVRTFVAELRRSLP